MLSKTMCYLKYININIHKPALQRLIIIHGTICHIKLITEIMSTRYLKHVNMQFTVIHTSPICLAPVTD